MSSPSTVPAAESFRQVARRLSEADLRAKERAKATHSRFNVFTTLLRDNDEVRLHTRFLHCLLDPEGLHDCGPLFLDLFFKMLGEHPNLRGGPLPWPGADEGWRVQKEAGRSSGYGQIDLLLEHSRFGIAIENKIHAREQPEQLSSYAGYLASRTGTGSLLIYLTLHGDPSGTHGGASYLQISYATHILAWLEECLRHTYDIIPVNQLLLQYRAVVRKLTGKTMEAETMKSIAQFITQNPDILRYRSQWSEAADEAKTLFLDQLAEAITRALPEYRITPNPDNDDGRFGTELGGLIIREADGGRLLPASFEIYLENAMADEELALGVFTNYDGEPLAPDDQEWLVKMQAAWQKEPLGVELISQNKPTVPWPLAWRQLACLADADLADLMDKNDLGELAERYAKEIRAFIQVIQRTAATIE